MNPMADLMHDLATETKSPPPGVLVCGHFRERFGYHVHRSWGTRDWLITYTITGRGLYRQEGVAIHAEPGDLTLLVPGAVHDYGATPEGVWEFTWAHFVPRPSWAAWLRLPEVGKGLHRLAIADMTVRQRIQRAFTRLSRDAQGAGAFREELALNALEEILLLAAREQHRAAARPVDPRIQRVLDHLAANLAERHTLADLAREVSLSPSRLAHLFKEQVGDSIVETILKLRLRQAARLLEFTPRQVKEIAHDVGFQSAFYFSRQFRAHFGVSPTEYRRRLAERSTAVAGGAGHRS